MTILKLNPQLSKGLTTLPRAFVNCKIKLGLEHEMIEERTEN
jgi:hypothetical protein